LYRAFGAKRGRGGDVFQGKNTVGNGHRKKVSSMGGMKSWDSLDAVRSKVMGWLPRGCMVEVNMAEQLLSVY
jgi:hypothetical protein